MRRLDEGNPPMERRSPREIFEDNIGVLVMILTMIGFAIVGAIVALLIL